jgi:hypothetical protein
MRHQPRKQVISMSMPETPPVDQADQSAVLPVHAVVAIVREWVELHARQLPDFAGAYLWGGITALPAEAPFHLYRDVDVVVVRTAGAPDDDEEVLYRGLSLEIIPKNLDEHQDAQAVLADPSAGPNLATTQILADPTGILTPLHEAVAAAYGQRRWVQARCAAEQALAAEGLAAMHRATTPAERLDAVRALLGALSGLLAVAHLKRPTTRRTLTLLGELLAAQGRVDLHEAALRIMGSAQLSVGDVQALHAQIISAFDRAAVVNRTPVPYGFAIQLHLRPYYMEATKELIDEGHHREAIYWIACLDTIYFVLQNDAPDAEKPGFAAQLHALYVALGYTADALWAERVATAERLAPEIFHIADVLAAQHPE